jgi:hypothetical protein
MEFSENLSRMSNEYIKMVRLAESPLQRQYHQKSAEENEEKISRAIAKSLIRGHQP